MAYQFTEELITGHPTIDSEHMLILNVANTVLDALETGINENDIIEAVKVFAQYVNNHFPSEEKLQEQYNYPNYRYHKLWHESYINDIELTCNRILLEGVTKITCTELKRRIETLVQHIILEDKKVAQHIQQHEKITNENNSI